MVSEIITVYIIESGGWSGATNGSGIGFELDWDFANPSGSGLVRIQASIPAGIPRDSAQDSSGEVKAMSKSTSCSLDTLEATKEPKDKLLP